MRMMQQYGFVLPGGNPADRIAFSALDTERCCSQGLSICRQAHHPLGTCEACSFSACNSLDMAAVLIVGMSDIRVVAKECSAYKVTFRWVPYSCTGGALSIQHMEEVLGDMTFVDMMGGRLPYLVAAMKSLPLREDSTPANATLAERRLVEHLISDCSKQLEGALPQLDSELGPCLTDRPMPSSATSLVPAHDNFYCRPAIPITTPPLGKSETVDLGSV